MHMANVKAWVGSLLSTKPPPVPPPVLSLAELMAPHASKIGAFAAVAVASIAIYMYLRSKRSEISALLSQWKEAADSIIQFAKDMDIGEELDLLGYKLPLLVNLSLLSKVQGQDNPRELSKVQQTLFSGGSSMSAAQLEEAARMMRFASAAYGGLILFCLGMLPPRSPEKTEDAWQTECICEHTGIAPSDLLVIETESLDIVGDANCLSHIVCVDRVGKASWP